MHILYPELRPYQTQMLAVGEGCELYVEQSGNPMGIPVVVLLGGLGAWLASQDRRFFNPSQYRIILFDQRGTGRSTPHGSLENNTTQHLLADVECLRQQLDIERWLVFGGSWGSALSLLYAQTFPERIMGMILRGVFLCREQDRRWLFQAGASRVFPDFWEDFLEPIPEGERHDLVQAYYDRLTGSNQLAQMGCAKAWSLWLAHCSTLRPSEDLIHIYTEPHRALALARIGAHYLVNKGFVEEGQLLQKVDALEGIPGIIVHGRYDMICPLDNAQQLHHLWHDSELHIIRDAGHAACEPSMVDALVRATRNMARRFLDDSPARA